MPLDYSQRRLIARGIHSKNKKLAYMAFGMGLASMLISLVHLILLARG